MGLARIQTGTGSALVICAGPMPKDDEPWGLPPAALKALGPKPCVVGMNARGAETMEQIMAFANERTGGRPLWLAALVGFSAGCQQVRRLWLASAPALALVLADGLHAHNPPDPYQIDYAREIVGNARAGTLLVVIEHTYIEVAADIISTSAMARTVTGWSLPPPALGETVRRVDAPPGGSPSWAGLVVYSTGSGPYDKPAHEAQAVRVLPLALTGRVRQLVELPSRPTIVDVMASSAPTVTPEPRAAVVITPTAGPTPTTAPEVPLAVDGDTILCVGDSLVQGLQRALADHARGDCKLHTIGVESSHVHDWNGPRLTSALHSSDPGLVLICLGANDAGSTNAAHAGAEAGELIDTILDTGAAVSWIAPPIMPHEDGSFRAELAKACASRGVKVFDTPALALPRTSDRIHVTPEGNRTWAAAIARWVPFTAYAGHAAEALQTGPAPSPGPSPSRAPAPAPGPPAPALLALQAQLDAGWPKRKRAGGGIVPSPEHTRQSPESDHEPGNALDIPLDPTDGPGLDALAQALLRDGRTHYVIWRRRIANNTPSTTGTYRWEAGEWRPYPTTYMVEHGSANVDPHTDHLHVSVYADHRDEAGPWDLAGVGGGGVAPAPLVTVMPEPLRGRLEPPPRPFRSGETRHPLDPTASLGERAVWFSIDEQRAGVHSGDSYRRGQGKPGDPWDGYGFAYAGYSTALPGEVLPHAYTGLVSLLVRTGEWHPRGDGYAPRTGDGAVWGSSDPRTWPYGAKGGRIERVMVVPDGAALGGPGVFTTIAADAHGTWDQRAHRVDEEGFQGWLAYPPKRLVVPAQIVVEGFGTLALEDYVARVVTGELGSARELQALAALATAARSYAVWMMQHEGWGTEAKPMPATERKQVVARVATPLCTQATAATRGGLVLHGDRLVLTSHVAGALWLRGAGTGEGGEDPTHTEGNVTYNAGKVGEQVRPSPIAATIPDNRGCLSQNGAVALARQGVLWPGILTFFYGSDIAFTIAPPGSGPRPSPADRSATKGSNAPLYLAAALAALRWLS